MMMTKIAFLHLRDMISEAMVEINANGTPAIELGVAEVMIMTRKGITDEINLHHIHIIIIIEMIK